MGKPRRLPSRFPVGTKYILESRGGVIHRSVELPDGRRFALPARKAPSCCATEVSLVPQLNAEQLPARNTARARRRSRAYA